MSKSVKMLIDGGVVTMRTDAPKEHVDKVSEYVNGIIERIKANNSSLNSISAYRYTMISLADEVIEMKELVDIDGLKKDVSDNELLELRKEKKLLEDDLSEMKKRLENLQVLLSEQNKELQKYRER